MPIFCPHTHQHEHTLNPSEPLTDIQECPECHGLIKYCHHCERANRLAARHCVQCGTQLTIPSSVPAQLLRPGEISQVAQAPSHHPLESSIRLPDNHHPYMWFSVQEGLLILSKNKTSTAKPLALHFLPGYRFDVHAGKLITERFPPYKTWIQQPLVSDQGLFIATENELFYFPTHGYDTIFAQQSWQPPSGYKIRAITLDKNGQALILVSDHNNLMQLFLGNTQSGQWSKTKIDLEKTAVDGGCAIAVGKATPDLCAVYDGYELLFVDLKGASVQHRITLKDAVKPVQLFFERAKTAYFEPFLIGTQGDSVRCIIPVKSGIDEKPRQAGVVKFESSRAIPTKTKEFPLDTWILPDPWGLGFMVWSQNAVQRYEGHQPSWDEEGGNFSLVQPLQTAHWFVGQAASASYGAEVTEIVVISATMDDDRYKLRLKSRPSLQNVMESKVAGMPPIQSNGRLFLALRESNNETAPVIVYTMQIA